MLGRPAGFCPGRHLGAAKRVGKAGVAVIASMAPQRSSDGEKKTRVQALEVVCTGDHCSVRMTAKVMKAFKNADVRSRARCGKLMEFYAKDGLEFLIDTQFRIEGRFPTGGKDSKKVMIYAFKAHQLRVYGGIDPQTGDFVCTEIEPSKQKDAADQDKLKRAARNLGDLIQSNH